MDQETHPTFYLRELQELYSAEVQWVPALRRLNKAASHRDLQSLFQDHLEETFHHIHRLEKIFEDLNVTPSGPSSEVVKELVEECDSTIQAYGEPEVKDATLICCAQRIEHYEITGYTAACAFARHFGWSTHVRWLEQTLREEIATDQALTQLIEKVWLSSIFQEEVLVA
jgi:ferritin-like metal-binding protein YciE